MSYWLDEDTIFKGKPADGNRGWNPVDSLHQHVYDEYAGSFDDLAEVMAYTLSKNMGTRTKTMYDGTKKEVPLVDVAYYDLAMMLDKKETEIRGCVTKNIVPSGSPRNMLIKGVTLLEKAFPSVNREMNSIPHYVKAVQKYAEQQSQMTGRNVIVDPNLNNDLIILTDVNKNYLISLKDEVTNNANNVVVIDHHDSDKNTVDASLYHIDSLASSTSEILTNLLGLYKIKYSKEVANYLLSGIYLDTNKLTKNVSPNVMKIVAKLLENGADMNVVTDWFAEDFNSDRRVQELVSRAQIITYSIATILAEEGNEYTREELAKAADYLLKYKVDASYAIGEIGDNIISISARSKERVNVGKVMQELGGGGNQYSAATKIEDSNIEEVGKQLLKTIKPPFYIK